MTNSLGDLLHQLSQAVGDVTADRDALSIRCKQHTETIAEIKATTTREKALLKSQIERLNTEIKALTKRAEKADLVAETAKERDLALKAQKDAEKDADDKQFKMDQMTRRYAELEEAECSQA